MTWKAPSFMAPPETEPWLRRVLDDLVTHAQGKTGVRWTDRNGRRWRIIVMEQVSKTTGAVSTTSLVQVFTSQWTTLVGFSDLGTLFVKGVVASSFDFALIGMEPQDE